MLTKHSKLSAVREFVEWAKLDPALIDQYEASFVECDTAVAFGKGHQSISPCAATSADHAIHFESTHGIEWADEHIGEHTWTRKRDGKVFRLAFNDHGWYS